MFTQQEAIEAIQAIIKRDWTNPLLKRIHTTLGSTRIDDIEQVLGHISAPNTCSNCRYWGWRHDKRQNNANVCDMISLDESTSKDQAFIDADASDDTGLNAHLLTQGTFYCNLHSKKITLNT